MVKRSPVAVDASPRSALRPERTLAPGAVTTLPTTRGSRERGASSLLGHPAAQVDLFARYRDLDRWLLSSLSTVTGGLTPATGLGAATDWWVHLAASAAKQFAMTHEWVQALLGKPVEPLPLPLALGLLPLLGVSQHLRCNRGWGGVGGRGVCGPVGVCMGSVLPMGWPPQGALNTYIDCMHTLKVN